MDHVGHIPRHIYVVTWVTSHFGQVMLCSHCIYSYKSYIDIHQLLLARKHIFCSKYYCTIYCHIVFRFSDIASWIRKRRKSTNFTRHLWIVKEICFHLPPIFKIFIQLTIFSYVHHWLYTNNAMPRNHSIITAFQTCSLVPNQKWLTPFCPTVNFWT